MFPLTVVLNSRLYTILSSKDLHSVLSLNFYRVLFSSLNIHINILSNVFIHFGNATGLPCSPILDVHRMCLD